MKKSLFGDKGNNSRGSKKVQNPNALVIIIIIIIIIIMIIIIIIIVIILITVEWGKILFCLVKNIRTCSC